MANDSGNGDRDHTWSFTVSDLEPMLTRAGKSNARAVREEFDEATAVAHPELVRDALGAVVHPADASDSNGADTIIGAAMSGLDVSESRESDHESLTAGTLKLGNKKKRAVNKGQTIADRYSIEESIAVGGMGRVHQVKHLHLGKVFALKQMHDSYSSDQSFRAKFYQEARLASGLSHRNIVSIVDFGEDPNFGVFMVMELVEGEPMSRQGTPATSNGLRSDFADGGRAALHSQRRHRAR